MGIFLSPINFSSGPKIIGIKKFQPEKRLPKILGDLFRVKIRWKWSILLFFICSKILGEAGKQEILQQNNVPKILDLKSSSAKIKYVDNTENDFDVQPRGSANRRDKRQEVNLHVKPNLWPVKGF